MKFKPYPKYKPSGVEWLGEIPAHWEVKRLKYISTINDEALPETTPLDFEFSYLDIGGVDPDQEKATKETMIFEYAPSRARRIVRSGDTIVSTVRTYLRAIKAITEEDAGLIVSTGFAVVRPKGTNANYLALALKEKGFVDQVVGRSVGVSYPAINASEIGTIEIPIPPIKEQMEISSFLSDKLNRLDQLVEQKQRLIDRLKEKRAALISHTVTKGLPPQAARAAGLPVNPKMKPSGVEWLGDVPEHWEVKRLKFFQDACVNGVWGDEPEGENELVCVRVADFDRLGLKVVAAPPTVRSVDPTKRKNRLLQDGDLLIEKSGGGENQLVGCVVEFDCSVPAVCSNFVGRIIVKHGMPGRFWVYVNHALYTAKLNALSIKQTTGIQNLDTSHYFDTKVAFPPTLEQGAIAKYLDIECERLARLKKKIESAIEHLNEKKVALITDVITGKINVSEVNRAHQI